MIDPTDLSPWLPLLNSGGVLGLTVLIAYSLLKRKVRTEGEFNDMVKIYEARLVEKDTTISEWKDSATKNVEINATQAGQITKLADIMEALMQQRSTA